MVRALPLLLAVCAVAAPLSPHSAGAQGKAPTTPVVPAPPVELKPADAVDREYVRKAALADAFELEAARIALRRAKAAPVRAYAQLMLEHYEGAADRLQVAAGAVHAPVPTILTDGQKMQLRTLREAPEQEFDRLYMDNQVAVHQEALAVHRGYRGDSVVLGQHAERHATLAEQHVLAACQVLSQVSGA